jgi:hypothetical protein
MKKKAKPRKAPRKLRSGSQQQIDKKKISGNIENDQLLALRGSGRELWRDEHADEYVRRLREDWD